MFDYQESKEIATKLKNATKNVVDAADRTGWAKALRVLLSEHKSNLLAKFMEPYLKAEMSAAKAEMLARADPEYIKQFEEFKADVETGEKAITHWEAQCRRQDTGRSLLSHDKETINRFDG